MSNRTSEAIRAVAAAWENEKTRVSEGRGTRDWTPEQQHDILTRGKAYDTDGRAFQGQHMKSVEMYPEYQGDPDNIQFLTREEHLEAHGGSWTNPTNWYFDPVTKQKTDFGDGPFIPCRELKLSEPVAPIPPQRPKKAVEDSSVARNTKTEASHRPPNPINTPQKRSFWSGIKEKATLVKSFCIEHRVGEKVGLGVAVAVGIGGTIAKVFLDSHREGSGGNGSGGGGSSDSSCSDSDDDYVDSAPIDDDSETDEERDYPSERSSPREHDVSGYERHQHGKTISVRPYKRGGKHSEEDE